MHFKTQYRSMTVLGWTSIMLFAPSVFSLWLLRALSGLKIYRGEHKEGTENTEEKPRQQLHFNDTVFTSIA